MMKKYIIFLFVLLCISAQAQLLITLPNGEITYDYPKGNFGCDNLCGPGAMGFVSGIDQSIVAKTMDWQHYHGTYNSYREDMQDSPAAHKLAILKLGFRYIARSCHDIISGKATPNKTIILLHPNVRHPILWQHWVVLAKPSSTGTVRVHWGNGIIKEVPEFEQWYSAGVPACAYEIIPATIKNKPSMFNKIWDYVFRKLF